MVDPKHYGRGTAAGHKGHSAAARQNSAEAASEVTETLARRHRQMIAAWTPYGVAGAIPEQISNDLGLPVHVIRPRAGELVKRKLLFEVGKRQGGLGCRVMAYSVTAPADGAA
ncbi:hypothetical protein A3736_01845 [Erythrobacter sp. HI0063]|uniref:hypothetical protein n=1 Tax=Erythrobacter sp. HI0063 TaxID=1822240 RepID=UPI0007C3E6F4|nr:hypothetical protein [Erythrobacter sp. HI0063]KZY55394.1 hypothetical protein A3736_01845 [Erythrobacter sp. HI0063]